MDSRLVRRQPERLLGAVTAAPGSAEKSGVYPKFVTRKWFLVFFGCFPTQKRFPFNEWFSRIECSADLPSCKCPLVSGSIALHVFASPSAQQRWQRAHVLVRWWKWFARRRGPGSARCAIWA